MPAPGRLRRRRGGGWVWTLAFAIALSALVVFLALGLTGTPLRLPVWVVAEAEARINRAMDGTAGGAQVAVALGGAVMRVDDHWVPRLELEDLRLLAPGGATIANLPQVEVAIDPSQLLSGRIRPRSLRISGAQLTLRRLADGRFDLALGDFGGPAAATVAEALDRIETVFDLPVLSSLTRIEADALTLTLDDRRAGRIWQVGDGRVSIENRADELAVQIGLGLVAGGAAPARADLTLIAQKATSAARITVTMDQLAAADLAAQTPALAWLGVLDAPISGRMSAAFDADGRLSSTDGVLDIAAGALKPNDAARPVPFTHAGLNFALDTAAESITISDLAVESATLRLTASVRMRVPGLAVGRPTSFLSQLKVTDLRVDPEGLFQEPVLFSDGAADLRLTLNPFRLDIGQVALSEGSQRLVASGMAVAEATGWQFSLDLGLNEIPQDRLLALWPVTLKPRMRSWLVENVQQGLLYNVKAGLRAQPGTEPRLALGYDFAGADVRFLRTLPPITDGYGYSTLTDQTYTIYLERGGVTPPEGGRIDVRGTVFEVKDITRIPAIADLTLQTDSTVTAALSLLDQPPFRFLSKAGFPVSVAKGRAVTTGHMRLPLIKKVEPDDVVFTVDGTLSDVTSEQIVKGRVLRAEKARLHADNAGLTIGGKGVVGKAAFDATWSQAFGPAGKGRSHVEGKVTLSDDSLEEFGIRLPVDAVSGRGEGALAMDLVPGGGTFRITSDMKGLALRLDPIALAKAAGAAGKLVVEGRLGSPVAIDLLEVASGAVGATGKVTLRADGGLDVARFSRVKSGDWLDASVDITGRGPGKDVAIAVTGGTVDLRRLPDGSGGASGGPPLAVTLDRLVVTEGIALTGFQGRFSGQGGLNGAFSAAVNGSAAITGEVAPTKTGIAARIRSDDAGAVIAAAGIFSKARGGTLDMTLSPRGRRGAYDGRADIANIQIRNAPVLAELLGAISVVGLLEQLNNAGLVFSSAQADFSTSGVGVEVTRSSAVGASLGVSMRGTYASATRALDMQGVISPVYLINGIGSILTRPGEGLFGFNYNLRGTAAEPKVSVNPLSILTPGMFREMFRAQPPSTLQKLREAK